MLYSNLLLLTFTEKVPPSDRQRVKLNPLDQGESSSSLSFKMLIPQSIYSLPINFFTFTGCYFIRLWNHAAKVLISFLFYIVGENWSLKIIGFISKTLLVKDFKLEARINLAPTSMLALNLIEIVRSEILCLMILSKRN